MSNAKWRKVFTVFREVGVQSLVWKFVRDDGISEWALPPANSVLQEGLGDVMPFPYMRFREIEWVEVPVGQTAGVVEALHNIGQFPIQQLDSGIRIVAYSW